MSGNYDGVARAVRNTREELASHITIAISEFMKRELGIWLTTQQAEKLQDWVEQERVA